MPPCYNGPNPIDQDDRMAIWKWAKENGIDHGLPFDKIHDAINAHFFAGQAKSEWITDILSGRKTPFRELSNEAWRKQYNRRQIIAQAQDIAGRKALPPALRVLKSMWDIPRRAAVFGHGVVFPVTHAGDLALRPQSWGVFMRGFLNTWSKSWSPAATERLLDSMKRQPLYDTADRSGLDIREESRTDQILHPGKGSAGERAWSILKVMRFELWNNEMQKYIKPGMTQTQVIEVGKNLAEWANHATGSAEGPISKLGGNVLFGPKLTQSKLSRIFADPVKTLKTFSDWNNATPGEKAAAWTRLSGATQYLGTGLGLLAVNQGVLWAMGQKDKDGKPVKINFSDPTKSDFLAFKGGGLEWSIPGLHSEIRTLSQILAQSFMDSKELKKASRGEGMHGLAGKQLWQYAFSKANPMIQLGEEIRTGHETWGLERAFPWSGDKGTVSKPPIGWTEYILSHGPIPLTGPIRYVYDQTRGKGASALDAMAITKGLIIFGAGLTGLHVSQDYSAAAKRAHIANQLQAR